MSVDEGFYLHARRDLAGIIVFISKNSKQGAGRAKKELGMVKEAGWPMLLLLQVLAS